MSKPQVFTIKLKPEDGKEGRDRTEYALDNDEVFIGWGNLNFPDHPMKSEMLTSYQKSNSDPRKIGKAIGCINRFYNKIKIGDLIITSNNGKKYVGIIESDAYREPNNKNICHRHVRKTKWLNKKQQINIINYRHAEVLQNQNNYFAQIENYIDMYIDEYFDISDILKKYSEINREFYIQKYIKNLEIGAKRELFVLNQLRSEYPNSTIEHTSTKNDRAGFDIMVKIKEDLCYFIEVKTTEWSMNMPFYMSSNELNKMKKEKEKYIIYRVYNFIRNSGKIKKFNHTHVSIPNIIHEESGAKANPISYRIDLNPNAERVLPAQVMD